ncbi:hypothetical protein SteCoe_6467 [Stentor coeruleus]|uniref:dual-specificity kinase n=1 Tax=Stentor coeruleus TaxID=5963 RepID=A0A1R2CQ27_9CILI|nr:hypothetical protein SteCoe_6467 [Stentor coeruleus]
MFNTINRLTPRSRVDELKALRTSTSSSKKKITASSLISTINNIVSNSENNSNNNTLVIFKPSVPLVPSTTKNNYKSPRERRINFSNISASTSFNSLLNTSQKLTPRPPSKPRGEDIKPVSLHEEFEKLVIPISSSTALKLFKNSLTSYEQNEILNFKDIYYMGFKCPRNEIPNSFDDENGNYKLYKGDHISYRYEIIQLLGKGSFGQVCKCFDHKSKAFTAIKIIKNKRRYHQQAEIEIKILSTLNKKDRDNSNNVIHLDDYFFFRKHVCLSFELLSSSLFDLLKSNGFKGLSSNLVHLDDYFFFRKHVCLSFELLSSSLFDLLKSNGFKGLSSNLVRRLAIQILIALKFTNSLNIIHCDLKPENILLKQANKSGIKVIDFGSSCFYEERIYTYIQSRFYRAPEIILGIPYTTAIDMWSFACIVIELITGNPLFPGESEAEQLHLIMEVLGLPPPEVLAKSTKRKVFFDSNCNPRMIPNSKGKIRYPGSKSLQSIFVGLEKPLADLMTACLEWNPVKRITPDEALESSWITQVFPVTPRKPKRDIKLL